MIGPGNADQFRISDRQHASGHLVHIVKCRQGHVFFLKGRDGLKQDIKNVMQVPVQTAQIQMINTIVIFAHGCIDDLSLASLHDLIDTKGIGKEIEHLVIAALFKKRTIPGRIIVVHHRGWSVKALDKYTAITVTVFRRVRPAQIVDPLLPCPIFTGLHQDCSGCLICFTLEEAEPGRLVPVHLIIGEIDTGHDATDCPALPAAEQEDMRPAGEKHVILAGEHLPDLGTERRREMSVFPV